MQPRKLGTSQNPNPQECQVTVAKRESVAILIPMLSFIWEKKALKQDYECVALTQRISENK